jgi:diguanylate cyclase (GGDEF)-like protein
VNEITEQERRMPEGADFPIGLEFPEKVRPFLIECLEGGHFMVALLDSCGRIDWANRRFKESLLEDPKAPEVHFRDILNEDSKALFTALVPLRPGEAKTVELQHPLAAGSMTISYQIFQSSNGSLLAIGSDRTEEKELIAQMSALIEDLHREISHRTELSQRLEEMATTDFLTGLSNRRHFDDILQKEWRRMRRYGNQFALLIIDLDRFKQINDRFGHQCGDEVLQKTARILKDQVRTEDIVARYGGDELAIIALGTDWKNAGDLGERLRHQVAETAMTRAVPKTSISVGIAVTSGTKPPADIAELISRADKALYAAKEQGRNRVVIHRDPADPA